MHINSQNLKSETLAFLRKVSIMSAAINGTPPISTVLLFAIDDDMTIYFTTLKESYKAKALEKDPAISLSVWEHNSMYVQATGITEVITDENEALKAIDKIADAAIDLTDFWPPVLQVKGHNYIVYKIKLNWLRTRSLSDKTIVEKESKFKEVDLHE